MEKIITASGISFDSDYISAIPYPSRAYIRIVNSDIATVARVFADQQETEGMTYGKDLKLSYARLVAVMPEGDAIKVILGNGA